MDRSETMLMNAGKGLLLLPSSPHEIVSLLKELEKRLQRVEKMPTQSTKYAMQPVIEALIAKNLLRHHDMDVNISVACCISEVLRIMVYKTPYSDEQMKDFFELVVITLDKLSCASGGCYDKMIKALRTLDKGKLSLMMCDLQLDGLIVRLFKQFLTVADSNPHAVVIKMKQIMVIIIEKSELLNRKLVDLLVTSVRKENKIASPVCWQLGREVIKKCATQLKTHLPKKVAEKVYNSLMETIPPTTGTSKLMEDASRKRKFECLDVRRNMVRPVRRCRDVKKHENKTISTDDPPMPTKSVTEAQSVEHGENLVGRRIEVWWPLEKTYCQGVVKSFNCRNKRHKVLYDDGEEQLLDLKQEKWKLAEMASRLSSFEVKLVNAGKGLLILPSSTAELVNVLKQMEKLLHRVQVHKGKQTPSESMKYAMRPIVEALIAKELLNHPDIDVKISVACCICDVLTVMDDNALYNDEQMKDFFELAVTTFEKLSGGCYDRMINVLRTLSCSSYLLLKSDLLLKGLIVRLFKQFLTSADSNSSVAVLKMKQIMIFIIEQSEPLNLELVDLLVTSVRKENQITSPVCWKLGNEVLEKCAAKLKPHLPDQVPKEDCNSLRERVQPVRSCKDATRHTVNLLHINSEVEKNHENRTLSSHDPPMPSTSVIEVLYDSRDESLKKCAGQLKPHLPDQVTKEECNSLRERVQPVSSSEDANINSEVEKNHENITLSSHDPPMPSTSVTEVSSDDDNEELIDLKGKHWELLENMSATPDSVSFDNGDESFVVLIQENWELVENVAHFAPPPGDIVSVQGYNVKQEIAPPPGDMVSVQGYNVKHAPPPGDMVSVQGYNVNQEIAPPPGDIVSVQGYDVKQEIAPPPGDMVSVQGYNVNQEIAPPPGDIVSVQGYNVKQEIAPPPGDIVSVQRYIVKQEIAPPPSDIVLYDNRDESLKKCAGQLKPHLPDQVMKQECNSLRERVQPVRFSEDATRHTVNLLHINSEVEKNHENITLSSHDPPMPSTSVIEVSSDDDNEEVVDLKGKQCELLENVSATPDSAPPPGDIVSVQGYYVKQENAPILEAIFKKHGDITARCFLQEASVITYFLEAICEIARLIETNDVTSIISKTEQIEFLVSEAVAANIDVSWLEAQLKTIHTRNEATLLMEMKVNTTLVKRAARADLIERRGELVAAQEQCVKAEECIKELDLVEDLDKPISTIIAKQAALADLRERCRERVVAQEQVTKAEKCVKVLDLVEEKLSSNIWNLKPKALMGRETNYIG